MNWRGEEQKDWSDQFIPEIKCLLGLVFMRVASWSEDTLEATDMVPEGLTEKTRIACRVRKHEFIHWKNEFTIRSSVPSGYETEFRKIMRGCGKYLFYAFTNREETHICHAVIGDLDIFREWAAEKMLKGDRDWYVENRNSDGTKFMVFEIKKLPPEFILFHSEHPQECIPDPKQTEAEVERIGLEVARKMAERLKNMRAGEP
jgi:hypothetical protein